LTALLGNVDYLERHGPDPEVFDEVVADAGRLARLADDLLALSREEAGERPTETVRLDELAREASGGRVRATAEGPVLVQGDRAALERALANLVRNAELYGPTGGAIDVTAVQENGWARLTVADEGTGLPPAEAEHAFGRFWRGGQSGPGSGLGLAIVQATAERHGGRAYAEGACFTIELPALRDVSESGATTEA
jgi:signal transduction histidine kinase